MELKELRIKLQDYGDNKGKHTGFATFSNKEGTVILKINTDHCDQIFKTCADSILSTAKTAADNLTCSIIEHKKSLEDTTPTLEA